MHFVRCWNKDVEVALIETFHSKKIVEKLQKAEEQRTFLVNIIKEQEEEIAAMRGREERLENGRLWIDKNLTDNSETSSTSLYNFFNMRFYYVQFILFPSIVSLIILQEKLFQTKLKQK